MFKFSKRNSEHDDLYGRAPSLKKRSSFAVEDDNDSQEEQESHTPQKPSDEFEKIKESYNLEREYEVYLETEKKYHTWSKKWFEPGDHMEIVADKLRKAEDLDNKDLRTWV